MNKPFRFFFLFPPLLLLSACNDPAVIDSDEWQLGPFVKYDNNPIMVPQGDTWEAKDIFNPAAFAEDDLIYMLYRAEDSTGIGIWNGTSRIGLATSSDGFQFDRHPDPIYEPVSDWELPGGAEDPRIVKIEDTYWLTYTAYDGETARQALASSPDLFEWERHGLIFPQLGWTKAGAIVPVQINGKYWMYFGDTNIWIAHSEDLIRWTPIEEPVMRPRPGMFDSGLIEPGPTPLITDQGILMLYNSADDDLVYRTGQALFDINDPTRLLKRSDHFFLEPDLEMEVDGQIPNVVFIEGLAKLGDTWFLYYGMGDSGIGVATYREE
ncbi:MAG: glycosidase [Balneolaceae bacterium]|nr:MAG: glycosidase [Balneolaceae bacterium]